MRNLAEPVVAADRLQEFGAAYANEEDVDYGGISAHIPHSYWDRLSAAITSTAKEFLDKQQSKGWPDQLM
ncbi:unnamed protein product [Gongylonema pulchrum]|uniref:Uncharacterized protein n=1 Tax=Gongylonema pulchrum TaxID=637853 RepID=A0A183ESD3_9BILA|nr:unnamed protein product [Gongylonema pulchrum]